MNKSLLLEMFKKGNHLLNEDDSFHLAKLYTSYLFTLICLSIALACFLIIVGYFTFVFEELSFNAYASLIIGYSSLFYSFRMINEKIIPYYTANPLMLIAIFYPGFFVAEIIGLLDKNLLNFNFNFIIPIVTLSCVINYILLNSYYKRKYH